MSRRRTIPALGVALLVLAAAGLAGTLALRSGSPPTDPHGTALPSERRVQLSYAMPAPSGFDGLHAKLVSGTMPRVATQATVLTDEQCQPDAQGVSHCLNRLRLPDNSEIEVRHPHDMSKVPCLAPGERVQLVPPLAA
jgi:hypothetical protein